MNMDLGANRTFDDSLVPDSLSSLIPYAKKWGVEKPSEQDHFVALMKKSRPSELMAFNVQLDLNEEIVSEWLGSLPKKHVSEMTDEDWLHPLWAFVAMYKIRELTGPGLHFEAENQAREKFQNELKLERYSKATLEADEAFRLKKFSEYIFILSEFENLISEIQKKKLAIAKKHVRNS